MTNANHPGGRRNAPRSPARTCLAVAALNLVVALVLAGYVYLDLSCIAVGEAIRPMQLCAIVGLLSLVAFAVSVVIGVARVAAGPRRLAACGWWLLMALSGLIPFVAAMMVMDLVVWARSLILKE